MTSGTTRGACVDGKAPLRSMTWQPAAKALSICARVTLGWAAKNTRRTREKSNPSTAATRRLRSLNDSVRPADSAPASTCSSPTGKSRSSSTCTRVSPTLPVAPIIARSKRGVMGTSFSKEPAVHCIEQAPKCKGAGASSNGQTTPRHHPPLSKAPSRSFSAPARSAAYAAAVRPHPIATGHPR